MAPYPAHYLLQELDSESYKKRTEKNVIDSDGTMIASFGALTGGSALTESLALRHDRPCLVLDLEEITTAEAVKAVEKWLQRYSIATINVAGPRASGEPLIYDAVKELVLTIDWQQVKKETKNTKHHNDLMKKNDLLTRREVLKLIGIGTGAALSPLTITGCAVDPVTGRQQLMLMSPAEEIALDKQQSPYQFSSDYGTVQDPVLNTYLDHVGTEVATRSHRPEMPFSFRAVNASYINAYAFPGGSIASTRGILVELENEAELAALFGHEIGHVNARHTAERATKGALAQILISSAAVATSAAGYGNYGGLIQDIGGLGAGALLAHYSRDNEREADELGMEYMTRTGYTPQGMVGLMEVLLENGHSKPNAIEMMFSTHPMSDERHKTAIRNAEGKYQSMLSAPDNRDRYMDYTAKLRKIKGALTAMQDGESAMRKKEYLQADQKFTKALTIAPDDYAALVMMSKCKMAQEKSNEAERYAQKASRIYPQEAQAHSILGMTSIINKKYNQAYQQFTEYDHLLPGNPEIGFFQGLSMEGMQRKKEAATYYYKYLQQVRQGSQAQYAYKKLQSWGYIQ